MSDLAVISLEGSSLKIPTKPYALDYILLLIDIIIPII